MRVWDAATGQELRRLEGHDGCVWSVSFSPDGKLAGQRLGWTQTVRVWDAATGQELRRLEGHGGRGVVGEFQPGREVAGQRLGGQDGAGVGRGHGPRAAATGGPWRRRGLGRRFRSPVTRPLAMAGHDWSSAAATVRVIDWTLPAERVRSRNGWDRGEVLGDLERGRRGGAL